jgi:MtN3 and saliva related transmembrane protein
MARTTSALILFAICVATPGCETLGHDTTSLLVPRLMKSEFIGIVAGFGTTFAAVPDLIEMLKRRSSAGMNPRMAAIMGVFQVLWIHYGLLIQSRPVIGWNALAVLINFVSVAAYFHFARKDQHR